MIAIVTALHCKSALNCPYQYIDPLCALVGAHTVTIICDPRVAIRADV
jgi:hypothetical protein